MATHDLSQEHRGFVVTAQAQGLPQRFWLQRRASFFDRHPPHAALPQIGAQALELEREVIVDGEGAGEGGRLGGVGRQIGDLWVDQRCIELAGQPRDQVSADDRPVRLIEICLLYTSRCV